MHHRVSSQVASLIEPAAAKLRAKGQKACVVLATDGLPNDRHSFERALHELQRLGGRSTLSLASSKDMDTPAHLAAKAGHADVLHFLHAHGCSLLDADRKGRTAVHYAAKKGNDACLRVLAAAGAASRDFDAADTDSLRAALIDRHPGLQTVLQSAVLAVNQEYATENLALTDRDEVAVIPPISGG